jgi:putative addiction module killer protein
MDYTLSVIEIIQSETFFRWLGKLKDRQAIARINARIRRLAETGNFGDVKPVRDGVSEMRIDYGPGYRLYCMQRGSLLVVLLAGGDKRTQDADIKRAIEIANEWKDLP